MNAISGKVAIPALAGAITTIVFWLLSLWNIVPPADVAAAVTLLIMSGLGYVTPHGLSEVPPPPPLPEEKKP